MLNSLGANRSKVFSEFEFIDIKSKKIVEPNSAGFFYKTHYRIIDNFKKSYLHLFPRRSCDAFFSTYMMNTPWFQNPFPKFNSIEEMHSWIQPLLDDEEVVKKKWFVYLQDSY